MTGISIKNVRLLDSGEVSLVVEGVHVLVAIEPNRALEITWRPALQKMSSQIQQRVSRECQSEWERWADVRVASLRGRQLRPSSFPRNRKTVLSWRDSAKRWHQRLIMRKNRYENDRISCWSQWAETVTGNHRNDKSRRLKDK